MPPHQRHALADFRENARRAFSRLLEHGYRELSGNDDRFAVAWSDNRTVVRCEGIHWGDDVSLTIGASEAGPTAGPHSVWRLLEALEPGLESSAIGQTAQMHEGAEALLRVAEHVLRGDHTLFAQLTADAEHRLAAWRRAEEQEHERLRAEGWVDGEVLGMPALIPPPDKMPPRSK